MRGFLRVVSYWNCSSHFLSKIVAWDIWIFPGKWYKGQNWELSALSSGVAVIIDMMTVVSGYMNAELDLYCDPGAFMMMPKNSRMENGQALLGDQVLSRDLWGVVAKAGGKVSLCLGSPSINRAWAMVVVQKAVCRGYVCYDLLLWS